MTTALTLPRELESEHPFTILHRSPLLLRGDGARTVAHDLLNYHPLTNDRTTAIRSADLLRFIDACGHAPAIVDLEAEPEETPAAQ